MGKKNPSWSIPSTSWVDFTAWHCLLSGFSSRSRQTGGRGRKKRGGGRIHTRSRARLASPSADFTTEGMHTGHPQNPGRKPHSGSTHKADGGQRSRGAAPKAVQSTPEILIYLCATRKTWGADWHQNFPPLSRHWTLLDDPGSPRFQWLGS